MDHPLTGEEIYKKLDGKVSLMTYGMLSVYSDLFAAMGPHKCLVILYETKKGYGHWTCLWEGVDYQNGPTIYFFDSYGVMPDSELAWIPSQYRVVSGQVQSHLSALMYTSRLPVEYSEHQFQRQSPVVKTCGRWVLVRLALRELGVDEFRDLMVLCSRTRKMSLDRLVVLLTK